MVNVKHLTTAELKAGLGDVRQSPKVEGMLDLIVARPQKGEREILKKGRLCIAEGLVGDNWKSRGSGPDRSPHPGTQITIMNSRAIALIAHTRDRWQLAGDQLYMDLDISPGNLTSGTRLSIGSSLVEITDVPHTGCKQFVERFGMDAMTMVNSPEGKELNLRGINTMVVQAGEIQVGDLAKKVGE